jgi:hypothetical protein
VRLLDGDHPLPEVATCSNKSIATIWFQVRGAQPVLRAALLPQAESNFEIRILYQINRFLLLQHWNWPIDYPLVFQPISASDHRRTR